jgi:2-polyprenyl-3-methyl-5-hydroxy-6-metoxy-1,4-benzoquinol methylase
MSEQPAKYYDAVYQKIIAERGLSSEWIDERHAVILPHIKGSVFDIGCGLGEIANKIGNVPYVGIDISSEAIDYAKAHCINLQAEFFCLGYQAFFDTTLRFETVLLLEVLEHVALVGPVVELAKRCATGRIIVTVPRDMPGRAHVHPKWTETILEAILGKLSTCQLFGGPDNDRWWLAIKEM